MPIDINELRSYKGGNVEKWYSHMEKRFKPKEYIDDVISKDEEWRKRQKEIDDLRQSVNHLQKTIIGPAKKKGEDCSEAILTMKNTKVQIKELELTLPTLVEERETLLNKIGNIVDDDVPFSNNEDDDNIVVSLYPAPAAAAAAPTLLPCSLKNLSYDLPATLPLKHDDLLWRIGGYEPIRGQNVAGHRGYFLKNNGVLLNQALINYSIAFLRKRDYDVLQPPYMMNKDVMSKLAQLDDFDEQLYKVSGKTDDPNGASEKYLIATSEQPICAYHKGDWIEEKTLPIRYAGVSTCFRKEAGSSGRDIRGIFRVHQFEKIEQFCITADNLQVSQKEQENMKMAAEEFHQSLGLPYRVVCIVSGELNDAAIKKYDLEAWFPGQESYRELVSCSNCTDYQARGVGARCGIKKTGGNSGKGKGDSKLEERASYVHMLNSTLCATGRAICCILENHQTPEGVKVPEVLVPFMGGIDFLPFVRGPMELTKGEKGAAKSKQKKKEGGGGSGGKK